MTTESKEQPQEEQILSTGATATKRPFEEIQTRAAITIHDLEAEDDEQDGDWNDDAEETEAQEEVAEDEEDVEDEEGDAEEMEFDEDVTVEELTEIVKDAGFEALSDADLATRVLRGGKKIAASTLSTEEVNERAQEISGQDSTDSTVTV